MKWSFRIQKPGEITRDPIVGEFFSTEAIENPAEALVREGIQNALDAKTGDSVRIRIFLSNESYSLDGNQISLWFDNLRDHLGAKGNGLREVPPKNAPCPYLVFEDFGTTGLQGDIHQPFDEPGNNNSFFYFFRAEGRSGKSETDRGRWGIGKHVFPRSSQISTYFGFTVRSDDPVPLLMGHIILKSHKVNGDNYAPDGYFGEPNHNNDLILPIQDQKTLDRFRRDFHLSRNGEPGLSIVVPYVDPEITHQHLKMAVVSDYFYPILKGELIVDVDGGNQHTRIDANTLLDVVNSLDFKEKENLISFIGLADWAIHHSFEVEYRLKPCTFDIPAWSDDLIPEEMIYNMKSDLDAGENMAFHVGIKVRERTKSTMSYFTVYLCQDGYKSGRPIFVRDGIIISDIRGAPRTPGVRSIVVVEDKPLATLLGDSENPAHTQWQKDSSNFKNKYPNGKNYIEFVTKIVSNIIAALGAQEKQKDPYLFADIFSLPFDSMEDQPTSPFDVSQRKGDKETKEKKLKIKTQTKPFQISKIQGGFKIIPGPSAIVLPLQLKILTAYDLRKGNPLSKYHPSDFRLDTSPIRYKDSLKGVDILEVKNNQMLVQIIDPDFQLVVQGFDEKRDLFVRVEESQND
ncbi:MAG: hypothetical protein AB1509_10830 [Chloroflexota bacterium]